MMEYDMKISVTHTDFPNTLLARVFITAVYPDHTSASSQVWQATIDEPAVDEETDPIAHATEIVNRINEKITLVWIETLTRGQLSSMTEMFEQHENLRVAAGLVMPGRP